MHSSRMRTSHALTVSGGEGALGGLVHPRRIFWGEKKLKKKENKKFGEPPRKFGGPPLKN